MQNPSLLCKFPTQVVFGAMTFGFFKDADSNVAPPPYLSTAVGAGDKTVICRMVWDDESIAATLTAPEGGVVRVRLGLLWHGTASVLVALHEATSPWWQ